MKRNYLAPLSLAVFALLAKAAPPVDWVDPTGYQSSMIVYAQVKTPEGVLYQTPGSMLAAFSGANLVGVASLTTGPTNSAYPAGVPYYPLYVHGNTEGLTFAYQFYDKANDSVSPIATNEIFIKDSVLGNITLPVTLVAVSQTPSTEPSANKSTAKGKGKKKTKPKAKPKKGKKR